MVFNISSIQNYVKAQELTHKWKLREREEAQKTVKIPGMPDFLTKADENYNLGMITMKMDTGKKLSAGEMAYLKENYPDIYAKAARIAREREDYERELKKCRTKEEVRILNMNRCQSFVSEIRETRANNDQEACAFIGQRAAATQDAHTIFINTDKYKALPKDEAELAARRKEGKKQRGKGDAWEPQPHLESLLYNAHARKRVGLPSRHTNSPTKNRAIRD